VELLLPRILRLDANRVTSFGHLGLLGGGIQIGTRGGWMAVLGLMCAASVVLWIANFRRSRAVGDTPTARVASAPQGYVELFGTARPCPGDNLVAPLSGRPCVWFRYAVEEKRGKDWRVVQSGMSDQPFLLVDATGRALIDPEGAEVATTDAERWYHGDQRYSEWLLVPSLPVYAIGDFATIGGANSTLDAKADVNTLLAEWKKNRPALEKRFDLDRNGTIDPREWELAVRTARRQVARNHQQIRSEPGFNVVRKPGDGRLFLLSNQAPEKLADRYVWWSRAQLIVALVSGAVTAVLAVTA
jgi:hypothetical protein